MPHGALFRSSRALHSTSRSRLGRSVAGMAQELLTGAAQGPNAALAGPAGLKQGTPQTQQNAQGIELMKKMIYAVMTVAVVLVFVLVLLFFLRNLSEGLARKCKCVVPSDELATLTSVRFQQSDVFSSVRKLSFCTCQTIVHARWSTCCLGARSYD